MITPTANEPRRAAARAARRTTSTLVLCLCVLAVALAACGQTVTPSPHVTAPPPVTKQPQASGSPSTSGPGSSASDTAGTGECTGGTGPHVDQPLEDAIPDQVGAYTMCKFSVPLSMFMNSATTGDKQLYTDWLARIGVKAEDTTLAVAIDLQQDRTITILGMRPAGADRTKLMQSLIDSLKKLGWPSEGLAMAGKPVVRAQDPTGGQNGDPATAYAYVKDDMLFLIVTDDDKLALEALIRLP